MHIKFLGYGTGSAAKAAAYLLGERDHKGVVRDHVQVLIGDPTQVAAVADSLGTVHRYSSAVIAFHPDDHPTPAGRRGAGRLRGARVRRPALRRVRVDRGAARPPESGDGVHVHVLIARVELNSGLAYNPAPPSWRTDFDHVRDAWNYEKGWARPDDPPGPGWSNPRPTRCSRRPPGPAPARPAGDPRGPLTGWVVDQVAVGRIVDRPTLLAALAEHVEITRAGKDYVSVRLAPDTKPIRLKGALYVHDFTTTQHTDPPAPGDDRGPAREAAGLQPTGPGRDPAGSRGADAGTGRADASPAGHARARLEHARQRRADFNQRRYRVPADRIRQDAWTSQRLVRRWLIWPPIAATSLALLIMLGSLLRVVTRPGDPRGHDHQQEGQPMQVLTGAEWTTCTWQGHKQPCRPAKEG